MISMVDIISTSKNSTYKYIKSLQQKKIRTKERCFTVEGYKSVSDAIRSNWDIELIAVSGSFYESDEYEKASSVKTVIIKLLMVV